MATAHSDCCFLRRVQTFLLTYLLTYPETKKTQTHALSNTDRKT